MIASIKIKKEITLLLFILMIAGILRFFNLGSNPPSINWDEASIGYNAYSILKTGKDEYGNFLPLSFRSFDDYKPPLYIYLTVPSIAVFGLNEFAVRFPAAFIGLLFVYLIYLFVKELFKNNKYFNAEKVSLISAFFVAISPWHIQFTRAAYEGGIGTFFLVLGLYLFLKGKSHTKFFLFFALAFVLSMYSYHSFRLINPIILCLIFILYIKDIKKKPFDFILALLIIILLSTPIYLSFLGPQGAKSRLSMVTVFSNPVIQQEAAEKSAIAKSEGNMINRIIYNRRFIFIPEIIRGYINHFGFKYLFLEGDGGVQHHAFKMGMLYLWDFPFIIGGFIFLLKRLNRNIILLISVFLIAVIPSSLTTGTPHPVRAIAMMPGFHIFTAIGIYSISKYLRNKSKRIYNCVVPGLLGLLFLNHIYYLNQYFLQTPRVYGYFWQYGNKQVLEFVKKHEGDYSKIYMTYAYDQPYVYYLFYNLVDPSWYQHNWDYNGNGEIQRFYRKIGKYEFKNIDFAKDSKEKNVLIIGTPKEFPENFIPQEKIYFPDGKIAYYIYMP